MENKAKKEEVKSNQDNVQRKKEQMMNRKTYNL